MARGMLLWLVPLSSDLQGVEVPVFGHPVSVLMFSERLDMTVFPLWRDAVIVG